MSPNEYCSQLRKATGRFEDYGITESIEFEEEIRAGKQIVISIKAVLTDQSVLVIRVLTLNTKLKNFAMRINIINKTGN